jgi:hypothetical protein
VSQKDYIAIAAVLLAYAPVNPAMVHGIALSLAEVFAADNPRFDRERFIRAVGF